MSTFAYKKEKKIYKNPTLLLFFKKIPNLLLPKKSYFTFYGKRNIPNFWYIKRWDGEEKFDLDCTLP